MRGRLRSMTTLACAQRVHCYRNQYISTNNRTGWAHKGGGQAALAHGNHEVMTCIALLTCLLQVWASTPRKGL